MKNSGVDESLFRSQYGEDRILAEEFAGRPAGCFVEVGSYNGESYSNTFYLERALGWTGLLVEADPELHERGKKVRPNSTSVNCAAVAPGAPATVTFEVVEGCRWVSSVSVSDKMLKRIEDIKTEIKRVTVPAKTLDAMLVEASMQPPIDFLSIDVEGHEWPVLQGFTIDRWRPGIVIIERNAHLPERPIMAYMRANGYGWRRTTGCNDWFYAGQAKGAAYALRLFTQFYLPKYLTVWAPPLATASKRLAKGILRRLGALDAARSYLQRRKRRHGQA